MAIPSWVQRVSALDRRYQELERLLATPEMLADRAALQRHAKELSELEPLVRQFRDYQATQRRLEEAHDVLRAKLVEPELASLARDEVAQLTAKLAELSAAIERLLLGGGDASNTPVIIEIRAGTGGLEASLFAADLLRMYTKYAARAGLKVEPIDHHATEAGGYKEIIVSIAGPAAFEKFKFEGGVHRVQRVPTTEASGRIHTSTATVAVLPEPDEVEVQINADDLRIDVFRSAGHGGQSVNTTDSAVRITHLPTGMVVSCQDERSQLKNKHKALRVLRARLLAAKTEEAHAKISQDRRAQVGTGERSEKIRTYNFPDRRVTDHRINLTLHQLDRMLEGELEPLVNALAAHEREQLLKQPS